MIVLFFLFLSVGIGDACLPCPAGYYTDSVGAQSCIPCSIGFYQPTSGQSSCLRCDYARQRGSTQCIDDNTGKKMPTTIQVALYADESCQLLTGSEALPLTCSTFNGQTIRSEFIGDTIVKLFFHQDNICSQQISTVSAVLNQCSFLPQFNTYVRITTPDDNQSSSNQPNFVIHQPNSATVWSVQSPLTISWSFGSAPINTCDSARCALIDCTSDSQCFCGQCFRRNELEWYWKRYNGENNKRNIKRRIQSHSGKSRKNKKKKSCK